MIPLTVAAYFLYPYINKKEYQKIKDKYKNEVVLGDSTQIDSAGSGKVKTIGEDFATLKERTQAFQKKIVQLKSQIDSLTTVNDSLEKIVNARKQQLATAKEDSLGNSDTSTTKGAKKLTEITGKKLADNVKSLLALDLEDLSPILNKMDDNELLRLYKVGSSLERKKLLRALESKRAAKLMKELM